MTYGEHSELERDKNRPKDNFSIIFITVIF